MAGGVVLDQATLSGEKISGKAAGTINPNGASDFALDLTSSGPSLPLTLGSAESPIKLELQALSVKAAGQAAQAKLDISAVLPSVATNATKVEGLALALHSDAFDVKSRTGPISGTVTAEKIGLDNPTIAPLIAGKITAKVAGSLAADAITIDSGSVQGDALGSSLQRPRRLCRWSNRPQPQRRCAVGGAAGSGARRAGRARRSSAPH